MSQTGSPLCTPSGPHSYTSGDTTGICAAFFIADSSMASVVTPAAGAGAPRMGARREDSLAFAAAATAVAATSDVNASSSSSSSSTLGPEC